MGLASIGINVNLLMTILCVFIVTRILSAEVVLASSESEKNKKFTITELCGENAKKPNTRMLEGAVLTSIGERNMDCVVTFQTDTILQRFMLRFERLQLDCNDHLIIYDGAYTSSPHKSDLSCRNTLQNVGTIFTHSTHVTLKYQTDQWGPSTNGFKLLVTAFKDKSQACSSFRCHKTNFCIDSELTCDDVNHCGDGSDESASMALCPSAPLEEILGVSRGLLLVGIGSIVVCIFLCATSIVICFCRKAHDRGNPRQTRQMQDSRGNPIHDQAYQMEPEPNYNTNGTFGSLQKSTASYLGSSAPGRTRLSNLGPLPPGNPDRPACGVGRRTASTRSPPVDRQCARRRAA